MIRHRGKGIHGEQLDVQEAKTNSKGKPKRRKPGTNSRRQNKARLARKSHVPVELTPLGERLLGREEWSQAGE